MPVREGMSGARLEIFLKSQGFGIIFEPYSNYHCPRLVFGSVRRLSRVVFLKPSFQVIGQANIALGRIGNTAKEIDILH